MAEVLAIVAEVEETTPLALAGELSQPAGDVLAVRGQSELARSGNFPLTESIRLREGTKNLLLASAHSAISPQAYFPRMSRNDAPALLASVREGQNQRGSFVARFIVPVEPAVGRKMTLQEEEPYGRRVMKLLMQALDGVRRVRGVGAYDELLSMQGQGVSGNLLAALAGMRSAVGAGALELSVSWARNRKPPAAKLPSAVCFPAEALDGLDAVAEEMRGRAQTKGFALEGIVTRLDREGEARAPGDIVLGRAATKHATSAASTSTSTPTPTTKPSPPIGAATPSGRRHPPEGRPPLGPERRLRLRAAPRHLGRRRRAPD